MTVFIGDVNDNEPKFINEHDEVTTSPLSEIGNYYLFIENKL